LRAAPRHSGEPLAASGGTSFLSAAAVARACSSALPVSLANCARTHGDFHATNPPMPITSNKPTTSNSARGFMGTSETW
jgi:hypothetical protein